MLGEAQLWVYMLEQEYPALSWNDFKELCNMRFSPLLRNNLLGELVNLKQFGSMEDYQQQFQNLLAGAKMVRMDQQVDLFIAGLTKSICLEVEMQCP